MERKLQQMEEINYSLGGDDGTPFDRARLAQYFLEKALEVPEGMILITSLALRMICYEAGAIHPGRKEAGDER